MSYFSVLLKNSICKYSNYAQGPESNVGGMKSLSTFERSRVFLPLRYGSHENSSVTLCYVYRLRFRFICPGVKKRYVESFVVRSKGIVSIGFCCILSC